MGAGKPDSGLFVCLLHIGEIENLVAADVGWMLQHFHSGMQAWRFLLKPLDLQSMLEEKKLDSGGSEARPSSAGGGRGKGEHRLFLGTLGLSFRGKVQHTLGGRIFSFSLIFP